jgi:hypothetical protein
VDNGTALKLGPGQVIQTSLVAVAYEGRGVKRIGLDGSAELE